jgi:hypothetical protein
MQIPRQRLIGWANSSRLRGAIMGVIAHVHRAVSVGAWVSLLVFAAWSAAAQDLVLKRVSVTTDPTNNMQVEATDGSARTVDPYYGNWETTHSWTSPPEVIGPEGISVTLNVGGSTKIDALRPGTGMGVIGFDVSPTPTEVFIDVPAKGSNSGSQTFTLIPAGLTLGSRAEIRIGAAFGVGATYVYEVVERGPGMTTGGAGGDDGIIDEQPVLAARVECPSDTIMISALPSLSCEIVISGWSYSSYPVEVLLPGVVDGWGNQANGLQSVQNGQYNAQNPTNWTRPEYRWWLPVFACPGQDTTGVNCQTFVTAPGLPVNMPIIVRQKDQVDVNLNLVLNTVPHTNGGVAQGGGLMAGGEMRFGSVWWIGNFLNIENGPPIVGPIRADWLSALWVVRPTGDGFVRLESRWRPGNFLHVENGVLEVGPIGEAWWSAQWTLEVQEGTVWFRIGNRWRQGEYLNLESGTLQLSPVDPSWVSAVWWALP